MKLNKLVKQLTDIQQKYGDLEILLSDQGGNEMEILSVNVSNDEEENYVHFDLA